jgi:release factor glutamine methyltransferase
MRPAAAGSVAALTVAAARRALAAQLRAGGIESPELDARILVGHALSLDHAGLAAAGSRSLTAAEEGDIAGLCRRRLAHEPVARIVGNKEFWSLPLRVDASTLVPRPETEMVVAATLAAVAEGGSSARALRIADIGTGSGAILLALLTELPNAFGIGSDASPGALARARDNARRLGLSRAARVACVACDLAAALRGPFDVIVSNPPYIASNEIARLPPEVRLFDPRLALDGGPDGLDAYRAMAPRSATLLAAGGWLLLEVGAGQAADVLAIATGAGFVECAVHRDTAGLERVVAARSGRSDREGSRRDSANVHR